MERLIQLFGCGEKNSDVIIPAVISENIVHVLVLEFLLVDLYDAASRGLHIWLLLLLLFVVHHLAELWYVVAIVVLRLRLLMNLMMLPNVVLTFFCCLELVERILWVLRYVRTEFAVF